MSQSQSIRDDSDEFHNIDLNNSIIGSKMLDDIDDDERQLSSDEEDSPNPSDQKEDPPTPINEYLDHLSKQLINDYAKYFDLKPTNQIDELNECIENLLTHMEEFYGLIERIRNESTQCLDQYTLQLMPKLEECKKLFVLIDKLERIVKHVTVQVSLMEREVEQAEKMMGAKTSTVKKLFSFISNISSSPESSSTSSSSLSQHRYVPPDIFNTDKLMKM